MNKRKLYISILILVAVILFFPIIAFGEEDIVPQNGIPLVIIRIDESEEAIQEAGTNDPDHEYGNIEEMNESRHHTTRCVGTMEIVVPEGFESEFDLTDSPIGEQELSYIRGRGNSTWMISSKKPYKIKYDKKQDVLGMGKNKEWGLLANSFDPTLTHNAIASWLGRQMGMEFTPKMVPVEVVMIGSISGSKYLGSYYLTELVDIGNNRVDIAELDEDETEDITGGYLVSLYYEEQDFKEPENTVFETEYSHIKLINENPYFDEGDLTEGQVAQREYIRDYINQIDDLIMNNDVIDENIHNQIDELMDLKSTADYWLIQEFFINYDGYKTSSNYLYKKEDGKLYWGPLWDFDLMLYMVSADEPRQCRGFNCVLKFEWLDRLRSNDPLFVEMLREEWEVLNEKLIELTQEDGVLSQYKERQRNAWNKNYELWRDDNFYGRATDIDKEFDNVYNIIDYRRDWFNENIDNIGKVYCTVSYELDGEIVKTEEYRADSLLEIIDLKPQKEGLLFYGWVDKETNESMEYEKVLKDTILVPKFVDSEEIKDKFDFYFDKYEVWVPLENEEFSNNSIRIYPNEYGELITKNITWTSSNEDVATVIDGTVYLHSIGQTTIQATLFDGTCYSYLLHVYGDEQEFDDNPQNVVFDEESYTLEIGETAQIVYHFVSEKPVDPNIYMYVSCVVEDTDIIENDYLDYYVIKGLKEGETFVTINIHNTDTDTDIVTKKIKVTVVAEKENPEPEEEPKPEITYEFTEGANLKYTIGDNGATFKINADYSLFENGGKVFVDDVLVSSNNYTSKSGSTIITFTKGYMDSLSEGEHTLKVELNNCETVATKFTVAKAVAPVENTTPKSGSTTSNTKSENTNSTVVINDTTSTVSSKNTASTANNTTALSTKNNTQKETTTLSSPKTGDIILIWISLMAVSVVGIVIIFYKYIGRITNE